MNIFEATNTTAGEVSDLAMKAADDAMDAIRRTAEYLNHPMARGLVVQIAVLTIYATAKASAHKVGGAPLATFSLLEEAGTDALDLMRFQ